MKQLETSRPTFKLPRGAISQGIVCLYFHGSATQVPERYPGRKTPVRVLLDDMLAREGACCAPALDIAESDAGYEAIVSVPDSPELPEALFREALPVLFPAASPAGGSNRGAA